MQIIILESDPLSSGTVPNDFATQYKTEQKKRPERIHFPVLIVLDVKSVAGQHVKWMTPNGPKMSFVFPGLPW